MYAVGVGKAVEEELREIASEPSELHVSYSPDFSTMTHLLENLKGSICPGEGISSGGGVGEGVEGVVFCCLASDSALVLSTSLPFNSYGSLHRACYLKRGAVLSPCHGLSEMQPRAVKQPLTCFVCTSESVKHVCTGLFHVEARSGGQFSWGWSYRWL